MKRLLFAALFILCAGPLMATSGPERNVSVDPVYLEGGNAWRPINVAPSTTTVVLISSAANNVISGTTTVNGTASTAWRERLIVNCSTTGVLALFPDNVNYTTFTSSFSVLLSSAGVGTSFIGPNNSYRPTHQAAIYGIWDPNTRLSGAGACGEESFWNGKR